MTAFTRWAWRASSALIVLAVMIAALAHGLAAQPDPSRSRPDAGRFLVIVSIDGLRPEFYLDPSYTAPTLRSLVASGSHARAAEPVFPSVTYPDHASIVTGVRPARHG